MQLTKKHEVYLAITKGEMLFFGMMNGLTKSPNHFWRTIRGFIKS